MSRPRRAFELRVLPDLESLSREAAALFAQWAQERIASSGEFTAALSGGKTPRMFYSLLSRLKGPRGRAFPWKHVHFFWTDERHVPPADTDSNYKMFRDAFLPRVQIPLRNIHRIRAENPDAQAAAKEYEAELRRFFGLKAGETPRFDLVLLGLGADGHTASLFPNTLLPKGHRLAAAPWVEALKAYRITMTPRAINTARRVVFLVGGKEKAEALRRVLEGPDRPDVLPAQQIRPARGALLWLADRAAASRLKTQD